MSDLVLMTGASGFLGQRLLGHWLSGTSARLVACVRSRNGRSPAERLQLATISPLAEADPQRVRVLQADLAAPDLGLDAAVQDELTESVTHIVHCGGVVRFDLSLAAARKTNTDGTASLLTLAERCPRLQRFDHISTAFVAGRRQGVVFEHELDGDQEHHNTYERSKFEAELLVRQAARRLPIAVHRPSIVTCERGTGQLSPRGAVARLMLAYATGALTGLPGGPEARLDLVSADFVTAAVFALARDPATLGGCYHLAAGSALATTLAEVRDLAAAHFGRPPLALGTKDAAARGSSSTLADEMALYAPYLDGSLSFDTTQATRALARTGLEPPALGDYFDDLARGVQRLARARERATLKGAVRPDRSG